MIARDAPRALKWQFALWVAGSLIAGCLCAWQGSADLVAALRSSASGAPNVEFWPGALFGLPLALACFCFAAMALLPTPPAAKRTRRGQPAPVPRGAGILLAIAIGCVPLAFLAAPIGRGIVPGIVEARGYRPCPPRTDERRPSLRWVRAGLSCG